MKIAIIQPYFFPYIGYFQLINAVDKFVFYDDVNFIKRGWIHRNNIIVNGEKYMFTIPCIKSSQNRLINEIEVDVSSKQFKKVLLTIKNSYKKAPFFNQFFPIIEHVFLSAPNKTLISEFAVKSILETCNYFGLEIDYIKSSDKYENSTASDKADRLITIIKENEALTYINPIGGMELYSKEYFKKEGVELLFLESKPATYLQFKEKNIPGLSIIDVAMFNDINKTKEILKSYKLI